MVLTIDFLYFNIIHLLCVSPPMCSDRATSRAGNTNYTDRSNMILFRLVQTVREIGGCMSVRLAALPARGRRPVVEPGNSWCRICRCRYRDPTRPLQACRRTSRHSRATIGNTRPADWKSKRAQHVRRWTTRFAVYAMNVRSRWVLFYTIFVPWMRVLYTRPFQQTQLTQQPSDPNRPARVAICFRLVRCRS